MDSRTIEMRLRRPAPDEPTVLPPLVLPAFADGLDRISPTVRFRPGSLHPRNPRLALAVSLLALAATGVVIAGALRLLNERQTLVDELQWPPPQGVLGIQDGFTMAWPEGWRRLAEGGLYQGDFTQTGISYERVAIILASTDLPGCPGPLTTAGPNAYPSGDVPAPIPPRTADPAVACLREAPLPPGAVRVTVGVGERSRGLVAPDGPAIIDASEPTREAGWTEVVDGQPARLTVVTGAEAEAVGAVESRTWDVIFPGTIIHVLRIRADIAGPDTANGRADAQLVVDSVEFAAEAPELEPDTGERAVVRLLDELDRSARHSRSDFYACFPREPGTAEGIISASPGEQLARPVPVTCTTSITASLTKVWRITLTITWEAGNGYPAGGHVQEFFSRGDGSLMFGAESTSYPLDAAGNPDVDAPAWFPQPPRALPAPVDGPLGLAPGSFVELLSPGIYPSEAPGDIDGDLAPGYVGWHAYVIGAHMIDGVEWYSIQWEDFGWQTSTRWIPALRDGRPTIAPVDPSCPTGAIDLDALTRITGAERLACFGDRELTIGPVTAFASDAGPAQCIGLDANPTTCPDVANVDWLEADPTNLLYGERGREGPIPPLPVWMDPARVGALPLDQWLRVTGHLDDGFARECRHDPTGAAYHNETALQTLIQGCRQRFVVTGFEAVAAP